ncbi:MAG: hypothetical protein NVSMB52_20590 [Chloroflexota bacterium]
MTRRLGSVPALLPGLVGVFFLSLYLLTGSSDLGGNGDTDLRYQTTQAIVDFHRLWIAHPMWLDTRVALGRGGHLYAFYGPGQTLLMIPLYVVGKVIAHHLGLPYGITTLYASRSLDLFLGAALATLFFVIARNIFSVRVALLLTLLFGAGSTAWPDAQSALEQTQVSLCLLAAVWALYRYSVSERRLRRWLVLTGMFAGCAVCTRYDAVIFVLPYPVFLYILHERDASWRRFSVALITLCVSVLPWLVLVFAWNYARFGSPFRTGLHEQTLGEPVIVGVTNLLLSPGKGLLWYLPVIALLPWAVRHFRTRQPALFALFASSVSIAVLFYANVLYWHGDPAWGPRYLYVVVPYFILQLGELIQRWRWFGRFFQVLALGIVGASFVLQLLAVSVTPWRFWYELQADRQASFNGEQWTGQPFHWGAAKYNYYWDVHESPTLRQFENVYEVTRLYLGAEQYRLTRKPDPYVGSNTADYYPVNTYAFWWADERHPLLGPRFRGTLVLALIGSGVISLFAIWRVAYLAPLNPTRRRRIGDTQSFDVASRDPV